MRTAVGPNHDGVPLNETAIGRSYSVHQGVGHDNMNVISSALREIWPDLALTLRIFLDARFAGEPRHIRLLAMIEAIERENLRGMK